MLAGMVATRGGIALPLARKLCSQEHGRQRLVSRFSGQAGGGGARRRYSLAIARRVPRSFPEALGTSQGSGGEIDRERAEAEHERYLAALRKHVPVLCLPALDDLPDSVFVEDTVVAVGNRAVVTLPGHPSRRNEVGPIRELLAGGLGMDVTDMGSVGGGRALCDGGDVLYTGRHLLVGMSGRTNRAALEVLEEGLGMEALPIPLARENGRASLHLKSVLTHLDDRTLVVPENDEGRRVFSAIRDATGGAYTSSDAVWLPAHAGLSCNAVSVGDRGILAQLVRGGDAPTRERLEAAARERGRAIEFVAQGEAAKCDGALTCCSVLLDLRPAGGLVRY
ncbi:unnamed protein product [Pseudo-nitzschia multistriata]|uniref:Uncharacterized protein n=1 Tax=Pseudo-nitzschia multistriata TaxID=183589 RepID=A0A448Z979_9STRA|nr:unnamed protein product [Pseudo-nitzschia multistriata]